MYEYGFDKNCKRVRMIRRDDRERKEVESPLKQIKNETNKVTDLWYSKNLLCKVMGITPDEFDYRYLKNKELLNGKWRFEM